MYEETGLNTKVKRLLYLCDKTDCVPPIIHITFFLERIDGNITLPSNEFETNPISDVGFFQFFELINLGFNQKFVDILNRGIPDTGNYMRLKENIGL